MNSLIIAEKKEVANAIVIALTGKKPVAEDGAFHTPDHTITWCSGHLLKLTEPQDHLEDYARWSLEQLPLEWPIDHMPIPRTSKQLKTVVALCKQASQIVHAGDPDPEGQLLVDEVLEYAGVTDKPTRRLLINDNNPNAILKSMQDMPDNSQYQGLSKSALARSVCDLRYGINMTRLYTLIAQKQGFDGVLNTGRVKTPILGLVVRRDLTHEAHEKVPFYVVSAEIELAGTELSAKYLPTTDDLLDDKKRLNNKAQAHTITDELKGQSAVIDSVTTKDKQRAAALPYNLLALQADASKQFSYNPTQVLELTQTLRDKYQAITYNRSDSRYLNDERHAEAPALITALSEQFAELTSSANASLKSKTFNSNKVTAHHAIIPTASVPEVSALPEPERNIYRLIVRQYLAQFYPPETCRITTVTLSTGNRQLEARGRVDVDPGWTVLFKDQPKEADKEEEVTSVNLETLQKGTTGSISTTACQERFTQPPPYYTVASLLQDLPRVARYVTDPAVKKLLLDKDKESQDEAGGIGTPATRDTMINDLFKAGFMEEKGKKLISTELGRQFIAALPDFATQPDMTALWHQKQKEIEAGEIDYTSLIASVESSIAEEVSRVKRDGLPLEIKVSGMTCPKCKTGILKQRKGQFGKFWSCSNRKDCGATFKDNTGKPDLTPPNQPTLSGHACPECEKPLVRRLAKKKKGQKYDRYWWGCSGFKDGCTFTCFDQNGQPKLKP